MFANHIEAPLLGLLDIEAQGLVGRGGVKAVRPPALVQRAKLEQDLIIQGQSLGSLADAIHILLKGIRVHFCRNLPDGRIARHLVYHLAFPENGNVQAVKIRAGWRPEFGVCNGQNDIGPFCTADGLAVAEFNPHLISCLQVVGIYVDAEGGLVYIGHGQIGKHSSFGDGFHPHRLPDTGNRRIPDGTRMSHLFSAGLPALVRGVQHFHLQVLRSAIFEQIRNVKGERGVTSGMDAGLLPVHPDIGLPVHGTEVQQHALPLPLSGNGKAALVPKGFVGPNLPLDAGQFGFGGKWNDNDSLRGLIGFILVQDGVVPLSVQIAPLRTDHLRTRILRKRDIGLRTRDKAEEREC